MNRVELHRLSLNDFMTAERKQLAAGHFPGQAIWQGAMLLEILDHAVRSWLKGSFGKDVELEEVKNVKFRKTVSLKTKLWADLQTVEVDAHYYCLACEVIDEEDKIIRLSMKYSYLPQVQGNIDRKCIF